MADALRAFLHWTPPRDRTVLAPELGALPDRFDESSGLDLFDRIGVPTVSRRVLGLGAPIPDDLDYPVVLKALSADLPHKTEAGAVALGLTDRSAVEAAQDAISARIAAHAPNAKLEGWLIQAMVRGEGEALIGYRVDAESGPVITVGAGGIFAELYGDVAVRLAPVDLVTAREMVAEVRGLKALAGWRGRRPGDLEALAHAVAALSSLAADPERRISEAEANPVMVLQHGVAAVDALIVKTEEFEACEP
jgi:hypothetical protein